jgi:hypothetical protein
MPRPAPRCSNGEARSSEVFAQLLERALRVKDYARVDALADVMSARLAPSELCETARHPNPAVRAVAQEALLQLPTSTLVSLLGDPVDAETARNALESQADEYESEEARIVVTHSNRSKSRRRFLSRSPTVREGVGET